MGEADGTENTRRSGETAIIQGCFAALAADTPGAFGLIDDAGQLTPPEGQDLVVTTDMIVGGEHYPEDARPQDIAFKALAVNVSDLVAKGAKPLVYLLSLALPRQPETGWLEGLSEGLKDAQSEFGCSLLGGDTTATDGPSVLSITAIGAVTSGGMVRRSGAKAGDRVYVTGTIGDAALGLQLVRNVRAAAGSDPALTDGQTAFLRARYWRPRPRVNAIAALREFANGAMDISDGLAGDFAKLCDASAAGGEITAQDVPLSDAASAWLANDAASLETILTGGDDYELLVSVAEDRTEAFEKEMEKAEIQVTAIGRILQADANVKVLGRDGSAMHFERASFDHFF